MNSRFSFFELLCVFVIVAGCSAGSGQDLDNNGRPLDEGGSTGPLIAEFKSIQDNVLTPTCTVCHAGAAAPVGLRLDDGNSFSMLVGVASVEVPGFLRVDPGNPDNSYLIQKIEGTASVGGQMPLNGPPLPQATIDTIRTWITNGALPPDNTGTVGLPPQVQSVTPLDAATVSELPTEIMIAFDKEMDASTINANTVLLTQSGGDGSFLEGNEVSVTPVSVTLSAVNPMLATMNLTGTTGPDDVYEIRLVADGASQVMDIEGLVLDGDTDGRAGGDFISTFTLTQQGAGALEPTWRSIQDNIFTPTCIVCHAGSGAPQGLQLDEANSFNMLVNIPSAEVPALLRVEPGSPDNSYLIQKLEGTAAVGERMPQGGPFLDQATIDVVRQWISDGAPPDATTPSDNSPPTVTVMALSTPVVGAVTVIMDAQDDVAVTEVQLFVDGTLVGTDSDAPFAVLWDTNTTTDGSHDLMAEATDPQGNIGMSAVLTVTVDNTTPPSDTTPPTITLSDPGSPVSGTVTLTATATDDTSVTEVRFLVDGAVVVTDTTDPYSGAWDSTSVADGDYTISAQALDGAGNIGSSNPIVVTVSNNAGLVATFQSIQDNIFTPICTVCHAGGGAPEGLTLDAGNSYNALVNVPSVQVPSLLRVNPGNPDSSYLIQKLEGTAADGDRMPRGGPFLDQATINIVRQWISNGAPETGGTPPDNAPPTVSILPLGSTLAGIVNVAMGAQDNVGVSEVRLFVDGTLTGSDTTPPYSVAWDTNTVADGSHQLMAEASDDQGNVGTSPSVDVNVNNTNPPSDVTPPTVSLSVPTSPLSGTVSLGANAIDDVGVTEVRFFIDGSLLGSDTTEPFAVNWDTTTVANGDYAISAQALDAVGNIGSATDVVATVNNSSGGGLTPTFASIQDNIFTPICTECHAGANPPEGLRLDAANSYASIYRIASQQVPGLERVDPGKPEDSYLIRKLEGTAAVGDRMPQSGPFLDQATIDVIRQWIDDGADETE